MSQPKNKTNSDYVLVYSTDPIPEKKKIEEIKEGPYTLKPGVRLERKGRGGKSVTVLFKLPAHKTLLKALEVHLKKLIGSGGTSYVKDNEGFVEIQGEHQKSILAAVAKFKWPAN